MNLTRLRQLCMAMPGATEQIQWGADLVFKVGGRMFCVACTEPALAKTIASFKVDDESFAELCEREGIIPAPYMARAKWIALERWDALDDVEYKERIPQAYALVKAKLPRKTQAALGSPAVAREKTARVEAGWAGRPDRAGQTAGRRDK